MKFVNEYEYELMFLIVEIIHRRWEAPPTGLELNLADKHPAWVEL